METEMRIEKSKMRMILMMILLMTTVSHTNGFKLSLISQCKKNLRSKTKIYQAMKLQMETEMMIENSKMKTILMMTLSMTMDSHTNGFK